MKTLRALGLLLAVCAGAFAQTAASLLPAPKLQFFDGNGYPLAGGLIYTCAAGSSCPGTPLTSYTDSTATSANTNPVVLDAAGMASIWVGASKYKIVVETSAGVVLYSQDNVKGVGAGAQSSLTNSCTTAAALNANCATTVVWPTAYPDTQYVVSCMAESLVGAPSVMNMNGKTTTSVIVFIQALSALAAQAKLNCWAFHQ